MTLFVMNVKENFVLKWILMVDWTIMTLFLSIVAFLIIGVTSLQDCHLSSPRSCISLYSSYKDSPFGNFEVDSEIKLPRTTKSATENLAVSSLRNILKAFFGGIFLPSVASFPFDKNLEADAEVDLRITSAALQKTILNGRVFVWDDFINASISSQLRDHIDSLLINRDSDDSRPKFSVSGLSNKALDIPREKQFDDKSDRMVRPVSFEMDGKEVEVLQVGGVLHRKLSAVRTSLSRLLDRPTLREEEMYYSVSLPGASLKRHLDERHEELKGRRGWLSPSRRSVSWLLFLSDEEAGKRWDCERQGGQLRSYPPSRPVALSEVVVGGERLQLRPVVGAHEGDLQVLWLSPEAPRPSEEVVLPVFLDSSRPDGTVALYLATASPSGRRYISEDFPLVDPSFRPGVRWERHLKEPFLRCGLHLLEEPALWAKGGLPQGSVPQDTAPCCGSLVLFDSVTLPHEVLAVSSGRRLALAGWLHEDVVLPPIASE